MRTAVLGVLTVATALSLAPLSDASAAEGDSDRGFPELGFEWYVTAPPAQYAASGSPSAGIDETLTDDGIRASYFAPNGSAPSRGQGDINLSVSLPYDQPSSSDRIDVDFSLLVDLQLDTGARFIDGLALPQEAEHEVTGAIISTPEVEWSESTLTIVRPPMPVVCSANDINQYQFQIAALGDNGYKYLVDADVSFGKRSTAATNEQKSRCGASQEPTTRPRSSKTPEPQEPSISEPTAPTKATPANESEGAPAAMDDPASDLPGWAPWALSGAVTLGGILLIRRFKKAKNSKPAYANDGTKISTTRSNTGDAQK